MPGKRKHVSKSKRRNAKMWAQGFREDKILGPNLAGFIAAHGRGRLPEEKFLRDIYHEYHARVNWRLADHEDPVLPEEKYDPENVIEEELSEDSEQRRGQHYLKTNRRIRRWFKYRMDKENSNMTSARLLDPEKNPFAKLLSKLTGLSTPPKARQAYQEYQHSQSDALKAIYKEEWDRLVEEGKVAADEKATGAFRAKVARKEFSKLPKEEQDAYAAQAKEGAKVAREEFQAKMKDFPSKDPEEIDKYIKSMGSFLGPILQGIHEVTGHHVLVLCGGPSPSNNGEIRTSYYTVGKNKGPVPTYFPVWNEDRFHKEVVGFFTEYLETAFMFSQTTERVREEEATKSDTARTFTTAAPATKGKSVKVTKKGTKKVAPTDYDSSVSITDYDSSDSDSEDSDDDDRKRGRSREKVPRGRPRPTPRPLKKSKKSNDRVAAPIRIGPPPKGAKREAAVVARSAKENVVTPRGIEVVESSDKALKAVTEVADDSAGGNVAVVATRSAVDGGSPSIDKDNSQEVGNSETKEGGEGCSAEEVAMVVDDEGPPASAGNRPASDELVNVEGDNGIGYDFPLKDLAVEPWLSSIIPLITKEFIGDRYGLLIKLLLLHESKTGYENSKKGLPVQNRPGEISKWLSNGRLRYKISIANARDFGKLWWAWWRCMQPDWRSQAKSGELLQRIPAGESLEKLKVHGANGFLVVIVGLYSWGCAVKKEGKEDESWDRAVKDVEWVLKAL
ncbi:hypothetical protein ONZ45_g16283 [Pleurotus djamor]|nr:hypothetical protein ONZ45_g16283 [Pleurotus djamor]